MEKKMREHMRERFGNAKEYSDSPELPKSLNIELNNTCNHKCVFCPFHGELAAHTIKPAVMDKGFAKKILTQASELGIGRKELGFYMAGEVFLYKDFPEIISFAKQLGFKYTFVTTNGALATPDRLDAVLEAGLDSIRFSVNGGSRETYRDIHVSDDYDRVLENVKYLHKKREEEHLDVAISLSSVVTKKTKSNVDEIREVFESYVDDILFIPIILENLKKEEVRDEWQLVDDTDKIDPEWKCSILFETMYINARGMVMPCCNAYHDDVEFYDLNKNLNLGEAWNCDGYKKYRSIFTSGGDDKGTACERCILRKEGVNRLTVDELI